MRGYSVLFALLLAATSCGSHQSERAEVTVAAAANLTGVFERLGPRFEAQTGIQPVFSFSSTAQLARQIENQAPFDIFAAADASHVDDLDRKGLLVAGSRAVYATGILALWIPAGRIARLEDLTLPEVRTIAIAKPDLAPYGSAAIEALKNSGILDRVEPKLVYAENINMAKQYGSSGNADAVFTAYSLVLHESGKVLQIDGHQPIVQELAIVARTRRREAAQKFVDYLLHGDGHQLLLASGYK